MKIEGRNPVRELLKTDKAIDKILIQKNATEYGSGKQIFALIKEKGVTFRFVNKDIINAESETNNHQGFIAFTQDFEYTDIYDLIDYAEKSCENPLIVLLDGIEDPHNLGSIIRVCECGGVSGLIIPKHRNVQVNGTVVKISAGATNFVKIARETNLVNCINTLKEKGYWIFGSDSKGDSIFKTDFKGKTALVIGSEGKGMKNIVQTNCDKTVSIPMYGKINSLNASVACGIIINEINRQKFFD